MRTRFLNIDYFTHSSSSEALNHLSFLQLPVPQLIPPTHNLCNQIEFLLSSSCCSSYEISSELDGFQIDKPLSQFFHEVVPQRINFCDGDFRDRNPDACVDGGGRDEEQTDFRFGSDRFAEKDQDELSGEKKDNRRFEIIQFETPELDFFLEEDKTVFGVSAKSFLSEVPEVKIPTDLEDAIPYPRALSESVYSVENITSEYHIEQKNTYIVDSVGLAQGETIKYPLLEVNEIDLEFCTGPSNIRELHLMLEIIGLPRSIEKHNLVADVEKHFGSINFEDLECKSEYSTTSPDLGPEPDFLNLLFEVDFVTRKEISGTQGASCVAFFPLTTPIHFQEVEILDLDSFQGLEIFFSSQVAIEPEACDIMFNQDMSSVRHLYDSTISRELALADDSFRSLPLPVLPDEKEHLSVYSTVEGILADLKPHAPSASDGIYLDWNLLREDACNSDRCSIFWNISEEITTYTDSELKPFGEVMLIDFFYSDETLDGSNLLESKEKLNELYTDVIPPKLMTYEGQKPGTDKPDNNAEKAPTLFESMSQFNDLDFFLNPRKSVSKRSSEPAVKEEAETKHNSSLYPSRDSILRYSSVQVKSPQWEIEVHQVKISDHINNIITNFQKCYLAILQNDTAAGSEPFIDSFELLRLSKRKLMEWIKHASLQRKTPAHKDETLKAFIALYTIKQMTWYLCFYGIHTTHLYVDNLCRNLEYMRSSLSFPLSLIEDAQKRVDNVITQSHPSLSIIQGILRSVVSQTGKKVLIVAEDIFWWHLKRLLTAMSVSFQVAANHHMHKDHADACNSREVSKWTTESLQHSDILLTSHENLCASFPFHKFGLVLEYGGSYECSRISAIPLKLGGLPRLHFLRVEMEEFTVARALCEGFDITQSAALLMEGVIQSKPSQHEDQKIENLLNFVPTEKACTYAELSETAADVEASSLSIQHLAVPFIIEHKQIESKMPSYPDIIIVVNTQNFDKEMLISRRSSYQKILSLEKEGVQVLEREISQPVDLILSAAMCLVWYDCKNIETKATETVGALTSIHLCVENVATNVLTSLSFAFNECILVFEGDCRFLTAIMESSDGLYAAAASLGIDLQLFCSYSSELTDEIVLSCIEYGRKLNGGQYPKMPESETLVESFLTRFPSINPVSAHAILSSGGILVEFLEWSPLHRIRAMRKYHVPEESVALFNALCSYGEQEESRSGMTESSSISSAADSNYGSITNTDRKRQRCNIEPHKRDRPMDDCMHIKTLNESRDTNLKPSVVSLPHQSLILSDSQKVEGVDVFSSHAADKCFSQKQDMNASTRNNLGWNRMSGSKNVQEDLKGEVIDLTDSPIREEDFFSFPDTSYFPEIGKEHENRKSSGTRSLSFDTCGPCGHPAFPSSAEINPDIDVWGSLEDHNRELVEEVSRHTDVVPSKDAFFDDELIPRSTSNTCRFSFQENVSLERPYGEAALHNLVPLARLQEGSSEQNMIPTYTSNTNRLLFHENLGRSYGETPLSNAIRSSHLQQGSPWTIKFLNKIREKRRIQQKSLLCSTSPDQYGYSDRFEKILKRKSPSTLDCYKYQGGSKSSKTNKQKWSKRFMQPLSASKSEKASAPQLQTWTPIDKRARQTLSFARNGNETQSKLVWGDGSVPNRRKRCRGEA